MINIFREFVVELKNSGILYSFISSISARYFNKLHPSKTIKIAGIYLIIVFITLPLRSNFQEKQIAEMTLEELMGVEIISASKFVESINDTSATVMVISAKDIADRGYTSLTQVFHDIPGFDIIAGHGDIFQLAYARGNRTGSANERTMLMVNGIEQNMLFSQHMQIDNDFPLTIIDRIEILYGPATAIYGANAFSGIINIITHPLKSLKSGVTKVFSQLSFESNNTRIGDITFLTKQNSIGLSLSYRRFSSDRLDPSGRKGFFNTNHMLVNNNVWGPFGEGFRKNDNRADDYMLIGRAVFNSLEAGYSISRWSHGYGSIYPMDRSIPISGWESKREIYHLKNSSNLTENLNWNFLTTFQKGGIIEGTSFYELVEPVKSWQDPRTVRMSNWEYLGEKWSIFNDFIYQKNQNWKFSGGLKFSSGKYFREYNITTPGTYTFTPGSQNYIFSPQNSNPQDEVETDNLIRDREWGVYLQAKWKPQNSRFTFVAGTRYDHNSVYGDSINPRLGIVWKVTGNLSLKTNYGSAFQSPSPRNTGGAWGALSTNRELKPDRIYTLDFNINLNYRNLSHTITLFRNRIKNTIMQGENLPLKKTFGLEYKVDYFKNLISQTFQNLKIHFNYTYTDSEYSSPRTNQETQRTSSRVGGIGKHKFNFIGGIDFLRQFHFNISFNYVGQRPTIVSNPIEKIDSFLITGISIQFKTPIKNTRLIFNISNIFNVNYYHPGYDNGNAGEDLSNPSKGWFSSRLPQPGRRFSLGISFNI